MNSVTRNRQRVLAMFLPVSAGLLVIGSALTPEGLDQIIMTKTTVLAVLPIAINAEAAVRTTDSRLVRLARSFSASDAKLFLSVVLPTAIPFVISGLRLAVGRAMIGIVVAEVYGSAGGIGMMMSQSGSRFETDRVFVGVLTIVAVGLLCAELLRLVEQRLEHWRA